LYKSVGRTSTDPAPARPVFKVQKGKAYRYRIINAGAIVSFHFQIQGHSLTVIEADGEAHHPLTVDSIRVFPGQRYSVVVNANQTVGNYWMHAPMDFDRVINPDPNWEADHINVNAVLHYDGAPNAEPTTPPPTTIIGTQLQPHLLQPWSTAPVPGQPFVGGADKVFNLTFSAGVNADGWGFFLDGIRFAPSMNPSVPTLLRILSGATEDGDFPDHEHTRKIKRGDTVEISISGFPEHPFHLHGHTFHVVQGATGPANFVNPPLRDVLDTAGAAPVIIRFIADNPGPWILHCHIDMHLEGGLAMVFAEDPEGQRSGAQSLRPSLQWQRLCQTYNQIDPSQQ
jgi:iron transport multicopper oxidase